MEIIIRAEGSLSPAEREFLRLQEHEAFASEADSCFEWTASTHWRVILVEDGQWVSFLGIVERTVSVAGQPLQVAGIANVITRPEWRRRGLARAAMEAAAKLMRCRLCSEFGLLLCYHELVPYYTRLGWQEVAGPLAFQQSWGQATWPWGTMVLPIGDQPWPEGAIDLCGPPW